MMMMTVPSSGEDTGIQDSRRQQKNMRQSDLVGITDACDVLNWFNMSVFGTRGPAIFQSTERQHLLDEGEKKIEGSRT